MFTTIDESKTMITYSNILLKVAAAGGEGGLRVKRGKGVETFHL